MWERELSEALYQSATQTTVTVGVGASVKIASANSQRVRLILSHNSIGFVAYSDRSPAVVGQGVEQNININPVLILSLEDFGPWIQRDIFCFNNSGFVTEVTVIDVVSFADQRRPAGDIRR